MDSSFTIKPRSSAQKTYGPRDPIPVREATETDLHISKVVTATGDGAGRQGERRGEQHAQDFVANPESQAVIYRERDVRANDGEHPDRALLRQRAYRPKSALTNDREQDGKASRDPHADLEA